MDQAGTLRKLTADTVDAGAENQRIKGIAIASGKGGVGKTNIVANTAFELARTGKKVLVFDADMGLGNIHILLGLAPRYNIGHVLTGSKRLREILLEGPGGIHILPASTGNKKYSEISTEEKLVLKSELEVLQNEFDYIIFDIGAGISANVMFFCSAAQDIVVICTPEPTSFSDAYAIMKVLSRDYLVKKFKLLVNMAFSRKEALNIYQRLVMVSDKFGLGIRIDFLGHIMEDSSVTKAVRKQQLFAKAFPDSEATKCITAIADTLEKTTDEGHIKWDNFFKAK
jgi:flagellar biosynthesis protein FlhG